MHKQDCMIQPEFLRRVEAAKFLSVSPRTVSAWASRKIIPCHRVSWRVVLYRKSDLIAALNRFRVNEAGA